MADNSKIEWTDHTGNLWWGCTKVHRGCDNCYAETWAKRWDNDLWGNDAPRRFIKATWGAFAKWQRAARKSGRKQVVFVGSMMDIFENPRPLIDSDGEKLTAFPWQPNLHNPNLTTGDVREYFFNAIVPACPDLIFLLLTKRPSNINKMIPEAWLDEPPANVMFGASVVDQKSADMVLNHLSKVNGPTFLSVEPLLEPIDAMGDFHVYESNEGYLPDWVIVGGESGAKRRPFEADWARDIRDACMVYSVPFFMKQIDKVKPVPADLFIRQLPKMMSE